MIDNTTAAQELLASSMFDQDQDGLVRVDPAVLSRAAELLAETATKDNSAIQRERDALGWATMRMSIALRLIRTFGMSQVALPGSGTIRDWLAGWIDEGMDSPLMWPSTVPWACQLLTSWGFQDVGGFIGKTMPTDGRAGRRTQ